MNEKYNYGRPVSDVVIESKWSSIRTIRDARLKATDYIVIQAQEAGQTIPEKWKVYRQALRDIPQTGSAPDAVVWPEKPAT